MSTPDTCRGCGAPDGFDCHDLCMEISPRLAHPCRDCGAPAGQGCDISCPSAASPTAGQLRRTA